MSNITRQRTPRLVQLSLGPFASVILLLNCFLLLVAIPKEPARGLVSLEETPLLRGTGCFNAPVHNQVIVCLTVDGRVSVAVSEPNLQQAVLLAINKKYGLPFSTVELVILKSAAFIVFRPGSLPPLFATDTTTIPAGKAAATGLVLTEAQLLDCIAVARLLSPKLTNRPAGIYLAINAQTKASLVMRLVRQLQQHRIHHLYLVTHCYA